MATHKGSSRKRKFIIIGLNFIVMVMVRVRFRVTVLHCGKST